MTDCVLYTPAEAHSYLANAILPDYELWIRLYISNNLLRFVFKGFNVHQKIIFSTISTVKHSIIDHNFSFAPQIRGCGHNHIYSSKERPRMYQVISRVIDGKGINKQQDVLYYSSINFGRSD